MAVCLPTRNTRAPLPCQQNMPHIMMLPPDSCILGVRQDGFMASWGSRQIQRLLSVQNKGVAWFNRPYYPFLILRCKVSSFLTPLQTNFAGWAEMCGVLTGIWPCIPILCNSPCMVQAEICTEEPWLTICVCWTTVEFLFCRTIRRRRRWSRCWKTVLELQLRPPEKDCRFWFHVLKKYWYACFWEPNEVCRLSSRHPCLTTTNNKPIFKYTGGKKNPNTKKDLR